MKTEKPGDRDSRGLFAAGNGISIGGRGRPIENWRGWLRRNTKEGTEIHEILLELARGEPKVITLRDGREEIIVPTAEVRARCAIHLDEMLHGKAVTQNEQQRAEREAGALAAVQALTYEELERRARLALSRGIAEEDATLVTEPEPEKVGAEVDKPYPLWDALKTKRAGDTLPIHQDEEER